MGAYEISSWVAVDAAATWEHATTNEGIGYELAPWVHMTLPRGRSAREVRAVLTGRVPVPNHLGRCWLLFLGLFPFEYDDLRIVRVEAGRSFTERSIMGSMERWQHHRCIEPGADGGSSVTDRLAWETRWFVPDAVVDVVVRALFGHRHRRLRKKFGEEVPGGGARRP